VKFIQSVFEDALWNEHGASWEARAVVALTSFGMLAAAVLLLRAVFAGVRVFAFVAALALADGILVRRMAAKGTFQTGTSEPVDGLQGAP
jgi:hypothetical protein